MSPLPDFLFEDLSAGAIYNDPSGCLIPWSQHLDLNDASDSAIARVEFAIPEYFPVQISAEPRVFTLFPKLPMELRLIVWKMALPRSDLMEMSMLWDPCSCPGVRYFYGDHMIAAYPLIHEQDLSGEERSMGAPAALNNSSSYPRDISKGNDENYMSLDASVEAESRPLNTRPYSNHILKFEMDEHATGVLRACKESRAVALKVFPDNLPSGNPDIEIRFDAARSFLYIHNLIIPDSDLGPYNATFCYGRQLDFCKKIRKVAVHIEEYYDVDVEAVVHKIFSNLEEILVGLEGWKALEGFEAIENDADAMMRFQKGYEQIFEKRKKMITFGIDLKIPKLRFCPSLETVELD